MDPRRPWRHALVLIVVLLAVYLPSLGHEFVNWDDPRFVTQNLAIQSFSPHNVGVWWSEPVAGKWRPATWASLALDRRLWGLNPFGFRLQALTLHVCSALLVMALGWRIGLGRGPALLAALVWALHPLAVEPVCWSTARNYLLAQTFSLGAVLLAAGERRTTRILALLSTIVALSAHELAVVTPLLVALDGWRQRRNPLGYAWPYLLVALLFGLTHLEMVRGTGILQAERAAGTIPALAATASAWIWPARLAPFYDPAASASRAQLVGALAFLLVLAGCCLAAARSRRGRELVFALSWTAVSVLPTAGLFAVASQRADRWLYMPSVGLALTVALALADRPPALRRGLGLAIVFVLGTLSFAQSAHWQSSERLWRHALSVAPSRVAHHNLGGALADAELPDLVGALEQYQLAAASGDAADRALSLTGAGRTLLLREHAAEALAPLTQAVELDPMLMQAHLFLSLACSRGGRPEEALRQARLATALAPDQPSIRMQALQCAQAAGASAAEIAGYAESLEAARSRALAHHEAFR